MKKKWLCYLSTLPFLAAIGILAGYASSSYIMTNTTLFGKFVFLATMLFVIVISIWIQTIAHELGHLLFGKLTGYRFCSFRIGSLVLVHIGEEWHLRRHYIPGTAGQCLMSMPEGETFPYAWYNLGGVLVNVVISLLALIPALVFHHTIQIVFPCGMFAVIGLLLALINGLPFSPTNDGSNLKSMRRSAIERKAFRSQLLINEQMTAGISLADMPDEWFVFPEDTDWTQPLCAGMAGFIVDRMMVRGDLAGAKSLGADWLTTAVDMPPAAEMNLRENVLLCEWATNGHTADAAAWQTKAFRAYLKAAKTPSALLIAGISERLGHADEKRIRQYTEQFEKACRAYLYPETVATLRSLQKQIHDKLTR